MKLVRQVACLPEAKSHDLVSRRSFVAPKMQRTWQLKYATIHGDFRNAILWIDHERTTRCPGSEKNGLQCQRGCTSMNATLRVSLMIAAVALVACKPSGPSAAYLAVCEGQPLRTLAHRNQAMEAGFDINREHDCVTKQSATAIARSNAQRAAEHTPAVMAARETQVDRHDAESKLRDEMRAQVEARAIAARERRRAEDSAPAIVPVEVNAATAEQLATLQWLDAEVARQIVAARTKRRFDNWTDLVRRVDGLSTVETGMRASAFGLTVNGSSLPGAEPTSSMARYMRRWRVKPPSP